MNTANITNDEQAEIITLIDDEGNEKDYAILFTFESPETEKSYVFYYDADLEDADENEEIEFEVYVSSYDDDNNIYPVTDETELDMIEEVYNTMVDEQGLGIDE
ncbi:DUF1292 domain-containing protein [Mycoplasma sp. P36-A1]|uniref:DUF1292 domain-containing protein n=1 Tax=Mycoplasma sp. P36-A1 TaxID=3252900 RepID=UPI003C2BD421